MKWKKDIVAYNLIFPIWSIIIIPPLFLLTMPANFIVDSLVCLIGLWLTSGPIWKPYKKHIFKVFLFGYLADIIGAMPLVLLSCIAGYSDKENRFIEALSYNVFTRIDTTLLMTLIIALVGWLIYYFNRKFVFKTEDPKRAHILSLLLAIFTAPYFFYFPVDWFWY